MSKWLITTTAAILLVLTIGPIPGTERFWGGGVVSAQSSQATLSGEVLDENNAVVPAVHITVLHRSTALQRHASTNSDGYFVIPLLPPGGYDITAEHDGFTTLVIKDVVLNANDHQALKIQLKVKTISASVTVTDEEEKSINRQRSSSSGTVIGRKLAENLPLSGRSFQPLFELAPGTVQTKTGFSEQGQFSVNGQRANANYFMVDGVSANIGVSAGPAPGQLAGGSLPALTALGGTNNLVSVDALQEVRIQTSSYAPEFGRTPGAQVSMLTRSGTNQFSGTLFEYFRHDALDANDWFANSRGLGQPVLRQHQFGGVLGGPLAKDRAHFFLSYEGLRLRQPQVDITEVPSINARRFAPPQIQQFLNAFPYPNGPDFGNGFAEFTAAYSDPSRLNATSLRLDTAVNAQLALLARYNRAPSETVQRGKGIVPGFKGQSLNTFNRSSFDTQTFTVGASLAVTSAMLNEFRANYSQSRGATSFALDDFGGAAPLPPALLFPSFVSPEDGGFQLLLHGGTNSSLAVGKSVDNRQQQINVIDNLVVIKGDHHLKFGIDFRRLSPVYNPLKYTQTLIFGDLGANGTITASLTGLASQVQITADAGPRQPLFTNFSAFAQDTWRKTPRLTLTYGLRWELNPPPSEKNHRHPLTVIGVDNPPTLALAPQGTPLWETTYDNFAPRFGLAYQLSESMGTTLRAGLGLFYDLGNGQAAQAFGSVAPFTAVKRLRNAPFPLDPARAVPPPLSDLEPPYGPLYAFDAHLELPRTFQWSASIEQRLGRQQIISAGYVAAAGRRLLHEEVLVNPNRDFTLVRFATNAATSDYHALQVQFQRHLSRGLRAQGSYTWSHSIDTASEESEAGASLGKLNLDKERGPSNFDVRHLFAGALTLDIPAYTRSALSRLLLRNWSMDTIFRARTATPVNVIAGKTLLGESVIEVIRPDLVAGVPLYLPDAGVAGGRRINVEAFLPPAAQQGTLGRNALRGFAFSQMDLALRRRFIITERVGLQFRMECFNIFNRPNFGNPNHDLSDRLFGQSTQMLAKSLGTGGINGGLSPLYQIGGPRSVQLVAKLNF